MIFLYSTRTVPGAASAYESKRSNPYEDRRRKEVMMKFSNGCWLQQKGCECFAPQQAYFTKIEADKVT